MAFDIEWQEFDPSVLAQAQRENRPILLLLTVPWCVHCRELMETNFAQPETVDLVRASFIAAHADAERRPDVNDRYGSGGWPTLAFLTPEGELITNENYQSADELGPLLRKVRDVFTTRAEEIKQGLNKLWHHKLAPRKADAGAKLSLAMVDDVTDAIYEKFDHRYGGWGQSSKFPHSEAIDFALVQVAKRNDARMREVVTVTLDRMMEGGIHDSIDGGFFRYSKTPDWRNPNLEKVLDANVQRMRCYLEAYQLFGNSTYRAAAEGIVRWMVGFMLDQETGAFFGSQDADSGYYILDKEHRRAGPSP